jgi:hypothetical protein
MQWKPSVAAVEVVHKPEVQPLHCSHAPLLHWLLAVHQHGVVALHVAGAPPDSQPPVAHEYVVTPVAPEIGPSWQSALS